MDRARDLEAGAVAVFLFLEIVFKRKKKLKKKVSFFPFFSPFPPSPPP